MDAIMHHLAAFLLLFRNEAPIYALPAAKAPTHASARAYVNAPLNH